MKSPINQYLKCDNDREKMNSWCETLTQCEHPKSGQPAFKKQVFPILSPNPL